MKSGLPLFPDQASTIARSVDNLYFFLAAICLFFSVLIFLFVFYFAVRYRRRSEDELPKPLEGSMGLELFWSVTPLLITMVLFFWGAGLYFRNSRPPAGALEVYVVGKQWMWKLQHPEG